MQAFTMNCVIVGSIFFLLLHQVIAPPPRRSNENDKTHQKDEPEEMGLEYNRYLKEVVDLLESDPQFKKKLEDAQAADIRSGKIAEELELVDHKVRTRLDEAKRQELERLRHLAQKQYELSNGIDVDHMKISSEHLDHENPHTFEMEDLKKLIAKVSADLVKADEKRKQEFKEYEMQKEFEKQQKLQHLQGSEKEAFERQMQENETKHKQHEPLHHPGSKQQLEEVWEKQDHMENQDFDPKVFFQLHDLDGNGVWDQNEVKTLFLKELDKMYEQGAPEDDMRERAEEMERMREHVFYEADRNRDGLISYNEFLEKTKQPDFEKDSGWESLDQKPVYTYEEYKEFERRRQEEVQRLIQQGLIPPEPVFPPQYGYHHPQPGYGHVDQQYQQQQQQQQQQRMQGHPPPHTNQQYMQDHAPPSQTNQQYMQGHPPSQTNQQYMQGHPPSQTNQQYVQGHPPSQTNQQYMQGHPPSQTNQQYMQGHPPSQTNQQYMQGHPPSQTNQQYMQEHQPHQANQIHQGYNENKVKDGHVNYEQHDQNPQHVQVDRGQPSHQNENNEQKLSKNEPSPHGSQQTFQDHSNKVHGQPDSKSQIYGSHSNSIKSGNSEKDAKDSQPQSLNHL